MLKYIKPLFFKTPIIFLIILYILLYRHLNVKKLSTDTSKQTIDITYVQKIFPSATKVIPKKQVKDIYDVYNDNKHLGKIIINHSDSVKGYAGKVPILIGIENKNKIKGIEFLPNGETPSFSARINKLNFMDSWDGKDVSQIKVDDVDAVTGATMTSSAVIKNVLASTSKINMTKDSGFSITKAVKRNIILSIVTALSLLLFFSPSFEQKQKKFIKKLRTPILLIEVVIFGFLSGTMISMFLFESWMINGIEFLSFPILYIIAALAILVPIFTNKPYFCIYACPFGALQELTNNLGKKLHIPQHKIPKFAKYTRKISFTIVVLIMLFVKSIDVSSLEPFAGFLFKSASVGSLSIAITFFFLSFFFRNPWCKLFCPTGNFLDILKKPVQLYFKKQKKKR